MRPITDCLSDADSHQSSSCSIQHPARPLRASEFLAIPMICLTTGSAIASMRYVAQVRSTLSIKLTQTPTKLWLKSIRRMARAADCLCQKETLSLSLFRAAVRSELRFVVIRSNSRSEILRSLKRQRITFVVGVLLLFDSAQAGPPFVTDDPEPPPPGGWEINLPFILERTPGRTEMDSPLFDLNYGLPNVQLKLGDPRCSRS